MVFYQLGAGFVTGLTFSMVSHDYVYLHIANAFIRPHYRYHRMR